MNLVHLTSLDNKNMQVDFLIGLLKNCGIDAKAVPAANNQFITESVLGSSMTNRFDFDILVPEEQYHEAKAILESEPEDSE